MNKLSAYIKNKYFSRNVHADFLFMFAKNEGKELLGKKYINLWILLGILTLTFLTVGFANGSLDYLQKKMSDPFVNWVSISIPYGRSNDIPEIQRTVQFDKNKDKFGIKSVSGYYGLIIRFADYNSKNTYFSNGRSISSNNPLLSQVLGNKNLIKGRKQFSENEIGIIVTEDLLTKLNYDDKNPYIYMELTLDSITSLKVPLPIISIVKELPGLYEFAFTPYFYYQRIGKSASNPFRIDNLTKSRLKIFIADKNISEDKADEDIRNYFVNSNFNSLKPMFNTKTDTSKIINGVTTTITFFPYPDEQELNEIFTDLCNSKQCKQFDIYRDYQFRFNNVYDSNEFHYLSIHFEELSKIRAFRSYMVDNFDLDIDMSLIESKENYSFISRLTRILSLILLVFSVFALTVYSSNVFSRHIEKIKMNLGTFKAFGLDNRLLKRIYLSLIFGFVAIELILSILIASILGYLGAISALLKLFNYTLDSNYSIFSLNSIWTVIMIITILFALSIVLILVLNRYMKKSPGDLIYNR